MKDDLSASQTLRKKVSVGRQVVLYRHKKEGGVCPSDLQAYSRYGHCFSFYYHLRRNVPFGRTSDGKTGCPGSPRHTRKAISFKVGNLEE